MTSSPENLMMAAARGDEEAFASLYDQFAPRVLGLIVRILGDRRDAEDVLQEVFREVWTTANRYDPRLSSVATWLLMTARSRAIDWRRQHRSREARNAAHGARPDQVPASFPVDARSQTDDILSRLPTEQRDAVTLAFFRGLTCAQIASVEDVPLGTAKTRLRLGMAKLRSFLETSIDGASSLPPIDEGVR